MRTRGSSINAMEAAMVADSLGNLLICILLPFVKTLFRVAVRVIGGSFVILNAYINVFRNWLPVIEIMTRFNDAFRT